MSKVPLWTLFFIALYVQVSFVSTLNALILILYPIQTRPFFRSKTWRVWNTWNNPFFLNDDRISILCANHWPRIFRICMHSILFHLLYKSRFHLQISLALCLLIDWDKLLNWKSVNIIAWTADNFNYTFKSILFSFVHWALFEERKYM